MLSVGILLVTQLANPIGVVTVAKGDAEILHPAKTSVQAAKSGLLIYPDDALETGENGWVEIFMSAGMTVRLAAASQLKINKNFLMLGNGRIWIQSMARSDALAQDLRVWGGRLQIEAGSTLVAERVKGRGVNISMIRGEALVSMKRVPGPAQTVRAGQSYWLKASSSRPGPQPTSRAIWALVESESRTILGDRLGLEDYLLSWLQETKPGLTKPLSAWEMPKTDSSIRGEAGTLFDSLLESAIRPAPFLENEVPPKGPNVRVEVNFEGS
jgi:hypothetical protein